MAFLLKSKSAVNKQHSFLPILPQYHICCLNYSISFLFLAHIMFHNKSQAFYCQTAIFSMSYLCNLSWVLLGWWMAPSKLPHPNPQNQWLYYLTWKRGLCRWYWIKDLKRQKLSGLSRWTQCNQGDPTSPS